MKTPLLHESEVVILRAAENILSEAQDRVMRRAWANQLTTSDVLFLGQLRGKADAAEDALRSVRISHEVLFPAPDPDVAEVE